MDNDIESSEAQHTVDTVAVSIETSASEKKHSKKVSHGETKNRLSTIGGQAVIEGVMMRGKTASALCVVSEDGEELLSTERLKHPKTKINKVPLLRGVVSFIFMLIVGTKALMKSADVFGTDDEEMPKGFIGFSVFLGILISVGLFIFLPSLIMDGFVALGCPDSPLVSALIEGGIRLLLFIGYLLLTLAMKDIRRTYMYHGAEHKTINCYEHGKALTVENVRAESKVHKRCGTTFLFIVLIVTILMFALANWLIVDIFLWTNSWWVKLLVRLVLLPIVAGISYEVLKFLAWLPDNTFTKILRAPGLSLQALTTREPDDKMIGCAIKAFTAVMEMDEDPTKAAVTFETVPMSEVRAKVKKIIDDAGVESCDTDWILSAVSEKPRGEIDTVHVLKRVLSNRAVGYAKKRATGVPLAYVLGSTEFWDEKIIVTPAVLIPRPETELVAEQAVGLLNSIDNASALDLCTGSGCIAKVLAKKTKAAVTAADISEEALNVARRNLVDTDVAIVKSDLYAEIEGTFDLIVSNPPYIASADLNGLDKEVKKEPLLALDGGADGLELYRRICTGAPQRLKSGGALILELGAGQAQAVAEMLADWQVEIKQDYAGIDRILIARLK